MVVKGVKVVPLKLSCVSVVVFGKTLIHVSQVRVTVPSLPPLKPRWREEGESSVESVFGVSLVRQGRMRRRRSWRRRKRCRRNEWVMRLGRKRRMRKTRTRTRRTRTNDEEEEMQKE